MPRNSGGTYQLPAGNPVVSGTPISSTVQNNTMGDIASELTNSLDRQGRGGMQAPIRTPDGTLAAPSHSYNSETGSGWFRNAANDVRLAVGGVLRAWFQPLGNKLVSAAADGAAAVALVLDTVNALSNATAKLVSWQNQGAEVASLQKDGTLASAAGLLTGGAVLPGGGQAGDIVIQRAGSPAVGTLFLGNSTHFLTWDGTSYNLGVGGAANGRLTCLSDPTAAQDAATKNYLDTSPRIAKAWAHLTTGGAGLVTVDAGYNITGASYAGNNLTVAFATSLVSVFYAVSISEDFSGVPPNYAIWPAGQSVASFVIKSVNPTTLAAINWASGCQLGVIVFGA